MPDNEQLCNYSLEIQDELTDAELNTFWLHVELAHQDTYGSILDLCRLKASTKANENPARCVQALKNTQKSKIRKECENIFFNEQQFHRLSIERTSRRKA